MASILLIGGTGLVGSHLTKKLIAKGHSIFVLTRSLKKSQNNYLTYLQWDPYNNIFPPRGLQVNHVINLAGAGIANKRWTKERKKELTRSRKELTDFVFNKFHSSPIRFDHYIGASAIGIYGNSLDKLCSESDVAEYPEFLSNLCEEWESTHHKFNEVCKKVSILRLGLVLSLKGGAMKKMYYPALLTRIVNYFGSGNQYYSWIHIDDVCQVVINILENKINPDIYNIVTPKPVKSKSFAKSLASAMRGPMITIGLPKEIVQRMFSEMSKTILNSNKVSAKRLTNTGYTFKYTNLKDAFKDLIRRKI